MPPIFSDFNNYESRKNIVKQVINNGISPEDGQNYRNGDSIKFLKTFHLILFRS
jgi:hypothetical protein